MMHKRSRKGFTLVEILIVVAIAAALVAIIIPIISARLERSKETADLSNVRAAYAEVMVAAAGNEQEKSALYDPETQTYSCEVQLHQEKQGWEDSDDITVGGINSIEDWEIFWFNEPNDNGGVCRVSFHEGDEKATIDWRGYTDTRKVQKTKTSVQTDAQDYLTRLQEKLNERQSNGCTNAQNFLSANRDGSISLGGGVTAYFKASADSITTMDAPAAGNNKTWINFTLDADGNVVVYNFARNQYAYSTDDATAENQQWHGNATIE